MKKKLYHAVVDANNDSSEFHRFCDTELLKMYYSVKTIRPTAVGGHFLFFILLAFECKKARHKKQQKIRMWVFTSAKNPPTKVKSGQTDNMLSDHVSVFRLHSCSASVSML